MIEIKIELPFGTVNESLLKERLAADFSGLSPEDLRVAIYDMFIIGVQAPDVDASAVDQTTIDTAVSNIEGGLGCKVNVLDWGEPPFA